MVPRQRHLCTTVVFLRSFADLFPGSVRQSASACVVHETSVYVAVSDLAGMYGSTVLIMRGHGHR